jgi:hypothetical protein
MSISYFHGTNSNVINVIDNPIAKSAINGFGFYVTLNIEEAKKYGKNVIEFVMEDEFDAVTRPIDQRYVEGLATLQECMEGGMEVVLTQAQATEMALDAIDVIVH